MSIWIMLNRFSLLALTFVFFSFKEEVIHQKLKLSETPDNGGSVLTPSNSYQKGSNISLVVNSRGEYLFKQLQGSLSRTSNSTSITMDTEKSVIGFFENRKYPKTLTDKALFEPEPRNYLIEKFD